MIMEAKHTPGPWRTVENTPSLIEAMHHDQMTFIAQAFQPQGNASIDEMWANARLIAAAPDLLAACELMVASGIRGNATLNAAITKARGGE